MLRVLGHHLHALAEPLILDVYELVFDFLFGEALIHLVRLHFDLSEAHLLSVRLPIFLEIDEPALKDMELLVLRVKSLLLTLLLLNERGALQEVVLNPELDNVHDGGNDDDDRENLQVRVWVEPGQAGDSDVDQRLAESYLDGELKHLGDAYNKEPHEHLDAPDAVVDVLVEVLITVHVDVTRVMDRQVDS